MSDIREQLRELFFKAAGGISDMASDEIDAIMQLVEADKKRDMLAGRIDELGGVKLQYNNMYAETVQDGEWTSVSHRYNTLVAQLVALNKEISK